MRQPRAAAAPHRESHLGVTRYLAWGVCVIGFVVVRCVVIIVFHVVALPIVIDFDVVYI